MKTVVAFLLFCGLQLAAQDMQSCPMHKEHMNGALQHQADVEKHGDQAMGFPHDKTTHHFRLYSDGGAIEVTVNDIEDSQNVQAIRSHLTHIVTMFSNGDFSIPMVVHDQVPPGVPVMKEKRAEISYSFEELPAGGRVCIKATNPDALQAIHDFLRFQIEDHHTEDTTDIGSSYHAHAATNKSGVSDEQRSQYLNGEGMGLAKAAELNHYPGPRRVLDIADKLGLSTDQLAATRALFDDVHMKAQVLGKQLLAREDELDALFREQHADADKVRQLTAEIANLQGQLRALHLTAHVRERALLSAEQVTKYDALRTYVPGESPAPLHHH
jgi:Spy/CpxP family protein refolding chaperone